jgi:hypothetical protein
MPEPTDIQNIPDQPGNPITLINSILTVIRALLPTSAEKTALATLSAGGEPPFVTLADAATVVWDFGNKSVHNAVVTITDDRVLSVTNMPDGGRGTLHVIQGAGAPYEFSYPAGSLFPNSTALDLVDGVGGISVLGVRKRGSNFYWTAIREYGEVP